MKKYKKAISILAAIFAAFLLQACGNDGMKYIEQCIEEGKYQNIYIIVKEFDIKETGKTGDLIADINNYNKVESLLHGQSGENDLVEAKRQILGFNGSYKKYPSFKEDVRKLEERIGELESHRDDVDEIIQKIQSSYDDLDYETMNDLITEYEANEVLVSDTSREQGEKIESLTLQYLRHQEVEEMNGNGNKSGAEQQGEWDDSWIGGMKEEPQGKGLPKDSIDTEMDILN